MTGICEGRVVVITGAGRGIGREHALEFARQGARVVVNDLGGQLDGSGSSDAPAEAVAAEIRDLGGEAVSNFNNVADTDGASGLIDTALESFGRLDVLVNNAGIIRDRMLVNMTEDLWDNVIAVHLRGTYLPSRCAAAHWREQAKAGNPVDARIINTTSTSGIFGNIGQSNYGAAKAGIAAFTVITSQELGRYGVTVNAVSPDARTRLTENVPGLQDMFAAKPGAFDTFNAGNISPLVVWSRQSGVQRHHREGVPGPRRHRQRGRGVATGPDRGQGRAMGPGRVGSGGSRIGRPGRPELDHGRLKRIGWLSPAAGTRIVISPVVTGGPEPVSFQMSTSMTSEPSGAVSLAVTRPQNLSVSSR